MAAITLHYDNAREVQRLFNNDLGNLRLVQDQIGVTITARDGWIKLEGDEAIGATIVSKSICSPLRTLCDNAGVEGSLVAQEVRKAKGSKGYNVATDEYEDLVAAGVVDPTKVTRTALQNAGSVAGLLLTTDCMITDLPEKEEPAGGGHGHDHGMGGMM